jgi:L-fuconolactonase
MIDSHHHLWRIGQNGCVWPGPDLVELHRNFEADELVRLAAPCDVTGTILVQSQPCDADTDYLLAEADRSPFILGVVGWVDLLAVDAPARIESLARHPKLRGLRPMLQGLPDGWIVDRRLDAAIQAMEENDLRFDALVYTRHLPDLMRFAERHPRLGIVIDHAAKPPLASGKLHEWRLLIEQCSQLPHVSCKFSGLLTEAGERPDPAVLHHCADVLLHRFGDQRLMWGSDWPVLNLAGNYGGWLQTARRLVRELHPNRLTAVFDTAARRFYRIDAPVYLTDAPSTPPKRPSVLG